MTQIWQCLLADYRQRTRQQKFIVSLLIMSLATLLLFPAPDANYQTLIIHGYRGIYNSAWIGVCLAMLSVLFLPVISFFLIKNALGTDRQTNTAQLIAATPIGKGRFLLAKWGANLSLLLTIFAVMLVTSLFVQLYYGESYRLDVWALVWPQLAFVLPMLIAVSAIALLFESVNWLRGGLGNLIYVFLWLGTIVQTLESVSGIGAMIEHLERYVETHLAVTSDSMNVGISVNDGNEIIQTFAWPGLSPDITHLTSALPFVVAALIFWLIAVMCFDRFSQSSNESTTTSPSKLDQLTEQSGQKLDAALNFATRPFAFTRLVRLEFKLLLKGQSPFWWLGVLILNLLQLTLSQDVLTSVLLPLSWLWCVLLLSQLGQMGSQWNTQELISYSQQATSNQRLASLTAALSLLVLVSAAGLLRLAASLEWLWLAQALIAMTFTVTLAFAAGLVSGSRRLFEIVYPILWYLGPTQTALYLDFFGVKPEISWQAGMPLIFLCIALGLGGISLTAQAAKPS